MVINSEPIIRGNCFINVNENVLNIIEAVDII
jgi:hypothetical protein